MKMWRLFFFLTLASVAVEALAADEIHWTITGQNSVTFNWRGTEDVINYGTSPGTYTNAVTAVTPNPLPTSSSGPFWEAKITGLQENTLYYYAIGGGPEHTFITPPPRGSSDFIVYAVGDIGSSLSYSRVAPVQNIIGNVYGNGFPDFALLVGDLSYGDDNGVADVDQHFNDVMVWSREAAYMPAWGNHEWNTSTTPPDHLNNYEGRFDFPNSQSSPGTSSIIGNGPGEDWYWFDYGNVRFIAYPEPYSGAWSDWNTKARALMDDAQADPAIKHIVTFGHRPAYSSGSISGNSTLKGILDGLGDGHSKYVLNLCGHSHNYERSFPQHGVVHVVVGTGRQSPSTFSNTQPSWSAFRTLQSGALKLRFTDTNIEGEFICAPANSLCPSAGFVKDSFVIAPGAPPVANDDSASTSEDTAVTIDVAANDTDPDGNLNPASATTACPTCANPANGTLDNNGDGSFTYTPNPNFDGSDSFVYQICDAGSLCDTASVAITVNPVADPPVANNDSASTSEDTAVTIDVAANDTDLDGNLDPASANTTCAGCTAPANGTLVNNGDGSFAYTPNSGFTGADSFVYQICDMSALCDTATVSITVNPHNDPPVATDDSASTSEDAAVTIDVAANDTDPDGNLDPASANTTCAGCTAPANGTLVNNGNGSFTYTPNPNFDGSDSFVYQICDASSLCDTASVSITVNPVADPPVANNDSASTTEGTLVTINVATNDTDLDGNLDPASANTTCAGCTAPANGTLVNNGDGSFAYTPNSGFTGADSFVYQICDMSALCDTATVSITVNPHNDPPVATDDSASTSEDTAVTIDVAANDTDPDGNLDPASANTTCANGSTGCTTPANGTLVNNGDGSFAYTPNSGFTGADSFVYEICDTSPLCDTASVAITVNPAIPLTIDVRVSASSDDAEQNASGSVSLTSADLELVVDSSVQTVGMRFNGVTIPHGAIISSAYVQFQVDEVSTDAATLTIQGQNVDNAATFSATTNDISSRPRTTAAVSWTPPPWSTVGQAGPDQRTPDLAAVVQQIVDRSGWASGNSLVIIITGSGRRTAEAFDGVPAAAPLLHVEYHTGSSNNPPVANDDSASTSKDTTVTINVADNDTDRDDNLNPASATVCESCAPPTNGALVNNGDGSFTYMPNSGFTGADSFDYEICDTTLFCDTATVFITVTSAAPDLIFADGFESGNLSAWSANKADAGDLSVSAAAALVDSNGMQALIDDNKTIYVTDDTPNAEPRYRARFYFDPNSIMMASGDAHYIFEGYMNTSTLVLRVEFRQSLGNYQVRARLVNDSTTWTSTSWFTIADAPHAIELDWQAATAVGANNGGLTLWIDDTQQANLTGVDNDTRRIDRVRLGAVAGIDTTTRGTYYFDAFESRWQTYIGP